MKYFEKTMKNPFICPFCGEKKGEVVADDGIEELYINCNHCDKSYVVVYNHTNSLYDENLLLTDIQDVFEMIEEDE